ncbi:trypsin Inhibitor like cysteine rich domain protein [Ancylostoma caninum]|uniref:Trypsin Inhibitor like cysteine rich domain protein n=1 Tax=Ancylostoma caninum TaxID=29170 RepID=A0A368FCP6_ANCCA|nr:trypsin Inhibitor like cysteine rich domain protein [Ancylostoma caninum]
MLLLVSQCNAKPSCGENQRYDECNRKECDPKCKYDGTEEKDDEKPVECLIRVCHGDCVCKDGFLRNNNGACVKAEDCELDNMEFIYPNRK